jgi:hypothetical protein
MGLTLIFMALFFQVLKSDNGRKSNGKKGDAGIIEAFLRLFTFSQDDAIGVVPADFFPEFPECVVWVPGGSCPADRAIVARCVLRCLHLG